MEESVVEPRSSWAFPLALCLLGPFLFLSVVFSPLAPFPALYLHQGNADRVRSRLFAGAAIPVGALICLLVKGPAVGVGFVALAGLPALFLGELLERRQAPETSIAQAFTATLLVLAALVGCFFLTQHIHPLPYLRGVAKLFLSQLATEVKQSQANIGVSDTELQSLIESPDALLFDLPGILLSGLLLLHILPTLLLIRWNPKGLNRRLGIPRDYLRSYSSPDWLVWPAIACLAFLLFETPALTIIASNLLKPLLIIYFFHGMSILAYFLDSFRLRGPLRYIIYGAGLVFLTPMVVSFGFFDLWFNFRSRFEPQS